MWFKRKINDIEKEIQQEIKLNEGSNRLLEAALTTSLLANDLASVLRQRLVDTNAKFESTARLMSDALMLCDLDGTVVSCNLAAETMFGANPQNILSCFEVYGRVLTEIGTLWNAFEINQTKTDGLIKGIGADGATFWVMPSLERLNWTDGTASVLVIIRNIDDVMKLEMRFAAETSKHAAIFESAFDGIIVIQNDQIVAANPSACHLFGLPTNGILNNRVRDLFLMSHFENSESNPTSAVGIHHSGDHLDLLVKTTDIRWNGSGARLLTIKDIRSQQRQDIPRRDNGTDMIVCFGTDYRITFANATFAQTYGETPATLTGRDIRTVFGEKESSDMLDSLDRLTVARPYARTVCKIDERIHDWVDHVVHGRSGERVEYRRTGRDIMPVISLSPR
jgi:PAS domain-containing protein